MTTFKEALRRMQSLFRKREQDVELDAEMESHLEFAVEENVRAGMTPDEARRKAMARFGGVQQARERQREARGLPWLEILMQDLKYTFRTLRRDRAFAVVAIVILGLGIGANIAVFSVVDTVLLRPLPFPDSGQLVRIVTKDPKAGESSKTYTADATEEFQQRNHSFVDVTGYFAFSSPENLKMVSTGQPLPVTGLMVMGNFFQTLGVKPMLGRLFTPEETLKNSRAVTLLSYAFWKQHFAGDPAIVGQAINFGGTPTTVIGVLPETFDFGGVFSPGSKVDVFTPVVMDDIRNEGNTMALAGRLKPGVTVAQAQAEVDLLFPQLDFIVTRPAYKPNYNARISTLKDYVTGRLRRSLIVLWCAVGVILLIVCVNLCNLLLARAAARSKEFALRSALGAGSMRLLRQLLTEALVLAGGGAALGLAIAYALTAWLANQGAIALPLLSSIHVDRTALAWTVGIALLTAVLFGLTPAWKISHDHLVDALKDSGQGSSAGRSNERMRSMLVISEVALACVLLVGAGLLLRSFLRVLDVDLGFEPSRAASIQVDIDDHDNADTRSALWQGLLHRVQAIPGVQTAGLSDNLPLSRNRSWGISAKGKTYQRGELQGTFVYIISPGYLQSIGMRLVKGRDFTWDDGPKSQPVVIINQTVARRLWPGQDAVGQISNVNGHDTLVVGVIADVKESDLEANGGWEMYLPGTQQWPDGANLVVRTAMQPDALASAVMSTLRQINPAQPATEFRPIQHLVDHAVSPRQFFVVLVSVFAVLGLVLAALGIYGVISYSVTQKTQEIGIRMALGATQGRVQIDVLTKTLRMVLVGAALGVVVSLAVARLIAALLFGTSASDPATFAGMMVVLGAVALIAGYIPARRASQINPSIALRNN